MVTVQPLFFFPITHQQEEDEQKQASLAQLLKALMVLIGQINPTLFTVMFLLHSSLCFTPYSDESPLYSSVFKTLPFPKPISDSTISQLFYVSLALSAWKSTGFSTWSLRVKPRSGNLHPTEAYIICPPVESVSDKGFVAHYAPKEHSLEIRAQFSSGLFTGFFPENSFLIGSCYCCCFNVGYEALEKFTGVENFPKFKVPSRGLNEFEVDYKELSCAISEFSGLDWKGKPNVLSKEHICWDIIYRTAEAAKKPLTMSNLLAVDPFQSSGTFSESSYKDLTLREVVRKQRSMVLPQCPKKHFIRYYCIVHLLVHTGKETC
uniref:Uncharacterized protein n=1 Tax=Solanum lycopersicum TaxID=4081 RepID=A0A3Q7EKH9_SOLLC